MKAAGSCGPLKVATPPACKRSSTGSPTSGKPRSGRYRSTCPPAVRTRSAPRTAFRTPRSCRPVSRCPARLKGDRPGPPRGVQQARPLGQRRGQVDQGHPLQPAQGHLQADRPAAAQARRGRAHQQAHVPRVPALRRTAIRLKGPQGAGRRTTGRVARVGTPIEAQTVRRARPCDREHKAGVLAAIRLGLSNARLEAFNSRVRLISHRDHGFHSANAHIAIIYLCCAGIQIDLPHRRVTPCRQESPISHATPGAHVSTGSPSAGVNAACSATGLTSTATTLYSGQLVLTSAEEPTSRFVRTSGK